MLSGTTAALLNGYGVFFRRINAWAYEWPIQSHQLKNKKQAQAQFSRISLWRSPQFSSYTTTPPYDCVARGLFWFCYRLCRQFGSIHQTHSCQFTYVVLFYSRSVWILPAHAYSIENSFNPRFVWRLMCVTRISCVGSRQKGLMSEWISWIHKNLIYIKWDCELNVSFYSWR